MSTPDEEISRRVTGKASRLAEITAAGPIVDAGHISVALWRVGHYASATKWMQPMPLPDVDVLYGTRWIDPEVAQRQEVAKTFARLARNLKGVQEVGLNRAVPELEVSVILREADDERDLELRGIFIDLMVERVDPSVGDLSIYTADDAPDWTREGALLT